MRPEQQIHRAVVQHLHQRGVPNLFAFHPANGGWRTAVEGAILKSMGVVPGVPDLIIIHDGKVFGLELKVDDGRLTDNERNALETMRRAGAIVATAHGLDAAITQLEIWGLLRRNRNSAQAEINPSHSATDTKANTQKRKP
jgi:hypothetical protein